MSILTPPQTSLTYHLSHRCFEKLKIQLQKQNKRPQQLM